MLATPVLADMQAGFDASRRGDYDTAIKEFRPLAEQGDPLAQSYLGGMYAEGRGGLEDYDLAVWSKNSSSLEVSEKLKNFNAYGLIEATGRFFTSARLECPHWCRG